MGGLGGRPRVGGLLACQQPRQALIMRSLAGHGVLTGRRAGAADYIIIILSFTNRGQQPAGCRLSPTAGPAARPAGSRRGGGGGGGLAALGPRHGVRIEGSNAFPPFLFRAAVRTGPIFEGGLRNARLRC